MREIFTTIEGSKLKGTRLLILILVAAARNSSDYSRPSVPWLVRMSGMSKQTVREILDELIDAGALSRVEAGGGKGKGATYRLYPKHCYTESELCPDRLPDDYLPPVPWTRGLSRKQQEAQRPVRCPLCKGSHANMACPCEV